MARATTRVIQLIAGVIFLLFGLAALVFAMFFLEKLAAHSLWYLDHFYASAEPGRDSYNALYDYALQITKSRNSAELRLTKIIGVLSLLFGALSLLWARNAKPNEKNETL